jgi:hypothetical protein
LVMIFVSSKDIYPSSRYISQMKIGSRLPAHWDEKQSLGVGHLKSLFFQGVAALVLKTPLPLFQRYVKLWK